jgi:outer membrane receptor protein involved in Fe transport
MCAATLCVAPGVVAQSQPAPPSTPAGPVPVDPVVVTATAQQQQILLDRRVYSVGADLQATTGSAAGILNQIPAVDVDADGNVTLRGDPNVTVLIDGKPSAQFAGRVERGVNLRQFSAQDIERVEVMTNPPAQYKAEGSAGVINIITRKDHGPGLSGTADLSLGDKRRFLAAVNGGYAVGKLKLSADVSVRQGAAERQITDFRTALNPASGLLVKSQETIDRHLKLLTPAASLGADYAFNDRQSVSLTLSHREQAGDPYFLQQAQSGPPDGPPTAITDRHGEGHEYTLDEGEGLRFDQKFGRPDELLSLSFQRSVYRERQKFAYLDDYVLPAAPSSQDTLRQSEDLVKLEAGADYTLPLGGHATLKLGYDFEDDGNRFDNVADDIDPVTGAPINNPDITSHFRYHQQVNAAYGQYEGAFGTGGIVQAGLRLEQTDIHDLLFTGDVTASQSYFRAYPSLNLDWKLGQDSKLIFALSRRVSRPDGETLNPFINSQDVYNLLAGNPTLLPQDTWSYEAGYVGKFMALNYDLTAYYRFDRNTAIPVTEPVSSVVTLTTIENLPKSKAAGLDFSAGGRFGSWISYSLSGDFFYSQINGVAYAREGLRDTLGINGKASLDWSPTPADTAQISFSRTDRRLTPQGYVSAINLVNVGYERRLWGGLSAVATVADLFDGQRFQRIVNTPTLQDNYNRHQFGRVGYFGFTYAFGLARKPKPSPFDADPGLRN